MIAKSMATSFRLDIQAFGEARRACRSHVLAGAKIRHEPLKLINSSIWGAHLFPLDLVKEVLAAAQQANQNRRTRWDLQPKRKWQEGSGHQPKSKKKKGNASGFRFQKPKQQSNQPQFPQMAGPLPPTPAPVASTSQPSPQYVLVPSSQVSPVYNPYHENTFRGQGYKHQSRGGRGRGNGGAGRQQGHSQQSQQPHRGGHGGQRRGRGGRGGQYQ